MKRGKRSPKCNPKIVGDAHAMADGLSRNVNSDLVKKPVALAEAV